MDDEEIKGSILLRLFITFLKHVFSDNHKIIFDTMVPMISEMAQTDRGMDYIRILLTYICDTSDILTFDYIEKTLLPLLDEEKRGEIMTISEQFMQKGKMEGVIEGEIKSYKKMLKDKLINPNFVDQIKMKISELQEKLQNVSSTPVAV